MPWNDSVHTNFNFDDVPAQARNKVNEVATDEGRNGNGNTDIDGHSYQHWRAGDYRIFGSWAREARRFNFVAYGTHTGRGNQTYRVTLAGGGTLNVTTD
jgi:mRNA-degrading endonuclease RelE of RelBE toxin-antitoxin system